MINKIADYFKSSFSELSKVSWPNRTQIARLTLLVIAFSLVVAAFIGAVDWVFSQGLERIILRR